MTASDVAPTVLLVDSNPMNVLRMTELLQGRGFDVNVCEDGDEAVDEYILSLIHISEPTRPY